MRTLLVVVIIAAGSLALSWVVISANSGSNTVTGKHPCAQHGQQSWCLTVGQGHTVYVPYSVYQSARAGYSYDPVTSRVAPPDPALDPPVDHPAVDPVVIDGR